MLFEDKLPPRAHVQGAVLFEAIVWIALLVATVFAVHVSVVRVCNGQLEALQKSRIQYDGVLRWRPGLAQ